MNVLFTIIVGIGVVIAALVCISASICAVEMQDASGRAVGAIIALVSLGFAVGGAMMIAKINSKD